MSLARQMPTSPRSPQRYASNLLNSPQARSSTRFMRPSTCSTTATTLPSPSRSRGSLLLLSHVSITLMTLPSSASSNTSRYAAASVWVNCSATPRTSFVFSTKYCSLAPEGNGGLPCLSSHCSGSSLASSLACWQTLRGYNPPRGDAKDGWSSPASAHCQP